MAGEIGRALGCAAYADNDGNLAALAESFLGAGQRFDSFAYVYIGVGVGVGGGGGVVLNGELWRGSRGNEGEFAGGLEPSLNPFPSLELLRRTAAAHGRPFASVDDMLGAIDADEPAVQDWIVKVQDSVSIIVSNAAAILDVEAIILGGLLPRALAERMAPQIRFFDQNRRAQARPYRWCCRAKRRRMRPRSAPRSS